MTRWRAPFAALGPEAHRASFAAMTLLFVASSAWLLYVGDALVTDVAPYGIVSFELAGNERAARSILDSWSPEARLVAALVQGYDFLYLLVYPLWLALCIEQLERAGRAAGAGEADPRDRTSTSPVACIVAWIALAAAPLDAIENHGLIQQLLEGPDEWYARVAWGFAVTKFGAVAIASAFILAAAAKRSLWKLRRSFARRGGD